ncbi:endonuclease-reverse transcriptase [Elysia marginata]|uniref:Endonuclease-reverse transcriptase n=1 Tax=Elysia marginata TaxID=1093978 RepID=A0AAV4I396_9GAST|nr:endonuclease-reverse transcriptase [Elysia marginata]
MDIFLRVSKEDTYVRNVVLQETSQGPMDRKEKQQRIIQMADVGERLATTYEAETWVYWPHQKGSSGPLLQLSLVGKIEGKRGQGRPRRNWMDDVKGWSESTSYGDTKRKAKNREEWRDMVANLRTEDDT